MEGQAHNLNLFKGRCVVGIGKSVTITDCHYNSVTLIVLNESGIAKTVTVAGV